MQTSQTNETSAASLQSAPRQYSLLHTLSIKGHEIVRTEGPDAQAELCVIARHLAASGHGRPVVECIDDADGRKPFGCWYSPSDIEIDQWKKRGWHREMSPDDARAAISKASGGQS